MEAVVKCSQCKKNLNVTNFKIKPNGNIYKSCSGCIVKQIEYNERTKCPCGNQTQHCKVCNDPIKVTIQNMIAGSRQRDKQYNRFDANNFIDTDFLNGLTNDQKYCYWQDCGVEMQYITYTNDLATIERLNNTIGHIKSNCVLACMRCNKLKKSNKK